MPGMPTKPRKDAPKSDRSARRFPFTVELKEPDYLVLLKHARGQSPAARRLTAAEPIGKDGAYVFTGYATDGLALRALAVAHAPKALPAIDAALKRAREAL
jgi:hypothetical protein